MVDIIHLNDDPHAQTQLLLPWYVNGTLDDGEAAQVARHLSECAECREDLAMEKTLAGHIKTLPGDAERGWAALKARIEEVPPAPRNVTFLRRRIPVAWALAAQAASIAVIASLLVLAVARPPAAYRTLGAPASAATGNLVVIFKPQTPEAVLRAILTQNQARIVDGPTATAAYVLHVAADQRRGVLDRLKTDRNVSLAEPIDGDLR